MYRERGGGYRTYFGSIVPIFHSTPAQTTLPREKVWNAGSTILRRRLRTDECASANALASSSIAPFTASRTNGRLFRGEENRGCIPCSSSAMTVLSASYDAMWRDLHRMAVSVSSLSQDISRFYPITGILADRAG